MEKAKHNILGVKISEICKFGRKEVLSRWPEEFRVDDNLASLFHYFQFRCYLWLVIYYTE